MPLIRERLSRHAPRNTADRLWLALGAGKQEHGEAGASGSEQSAAEAIPSKRAAVATILRDSLEGPEVLLIRRAEHPQDPWSGHMAFPGGREAPEDRDLLATAIRETHEELGLNLESSALLLGRLDMLPAVARGRRVGLTIAPFVFELTGEASLQPNYEVAEWLWAPLSPLLSGALATSMPYEFEGQRISLPAHDIEGRLVWGLTYRMLESLFAQLR